MPQIPTFSEYLASLGSLTVYVDPTAVSDEAANIKAAAASLAALKDITTTTLAAWASENPNWVQVLGLAVGLSQEKLKNTLKHHLGTSGWITLAREHPADLVGMLDKEFNLVQLIKSQRARTYDFGDILVARAGTRQTATAAGASGRKVEDEIEAIAIALGLPYRTRTRYIMAVIDGIGWKNRVNDLRRIYALWESQQIDGMYTLATLDVFRIDLQKAAVLRGLHPPPGP